MCVFVHLVYYMRKRTLFNIDYGGKQQNDARAHTHIIPADSGLVSQHRGSEVHHVEEHVGHRQCDSWRLVLCRPEAGTTV